MAAPIITGGRRELGITCPGCNHQSSIPPSAIARNAYFCGMCGKAIDLHGAFRQMMGEGNGPTMPRRDKGGSKYKSARKARR
jgi:DNA-directed RNA polymerase subunit RPC12/RpoP